MANPTTIPDLPREFLESEDSLVNMFTAVGVLAHADLVDAAAKFETVREAESRATAALESSEAPAAVAYRQAKDEADATLESIKAERDKEIDAIRQRFNSQISEVKSALKEQETLVLKEIQADSVSEINVTELVENYTTKHTAMKMLANNLKEHCPELHAWVKSLPSRAAQANGGAANSDRVKNWTPRFMSIVVTDPDGNVTNVEPTTMGATTKVVGGTRQFLANQLLAAIGDPANLSSDPESPTVFTITKNGQLWTIAVVERVTKSDDDE